MLEWAQTTRKSAMGMAAVTCFLLAALLTFDYKGFEWVTQWWFWLIAGLAVLAWAGVARNDWLAAGADWAQVKRRGGGAWVDTYHLTEVKFGAAGYKRILGLKDIHGNSIDTLPLRDSQANSALWDLVYNGILHSVASGNCTINTKTRRALQIPDEL